VGFLGRLDPIKGLETLAAAAESFPADGLRVLVGGVGEPGYAESIASKYPLANLEFLGKVAPSDFFEEIDYLIVPSLVEDSLPRVAHEAFMYGVPVIGARIGGIPEMITVRETGLLFNSGDTDELRACLRTVLSQPDRYAQMSAACLKASQRYSLDRIFTEYMEAWKSSSSGRPHHAAR
jgi:glycosyltransferase involved in cell wall biosynthesis